LRRHKKVVTQLGTATLCFSTSFIFFSPNVNIGGADEECKASQGLLPPATPFRGPPRLPPPTTSTNHHLFPDPPPRRQVTYSASDMTSSTLLSHEHRQHQHDSSSSPLLQFLESGGAGVVFETHVLQKLDAMDLRLLSRVSRDCRDAVLSSDLPRVGASPKLPGRCSVRTRRGGNAERSCGEALSTATNHPGNPALGAPAPPLLCSPRHPCLPRTRHGRLATA
jgi:hypothetical protein